MKEITWRPIVGYEGYYEVSSDGRVRSIERYCVRGSKRCLLKQKEAKPFIDRHGYIRISLYKNNIKHQYMAHRLVALAFIPNPLNLPFINHKDEIKTNNNVENLEWCTPKYNSNYGTCAQRIGDKLSVPIIQVTLKGEYLREFSSISEAARSLGVRNGHIVAACKGTRRNAYGYKWRYKDENLYQKALTTLAKTEERIKDSISYRRRNIIKVRGRKIRQFTLDGFFVKEYEAIGDAQINTGVSRVGISNCCRGLRNKAGGYKWCYAQ